MTTPASANRRLLQLDVLRGVAILLVVGRHLELPRPGGLVGAAADLWFTIGWLGVDLFFVLSGFLIGGLLLVEYEKRGRFDVGRFLIRRGLKIYPPYFVFIAYLVLMPTAKAVVRAGEAWKTLAEQATLYWPNLLFLQNYVGTNPAGHTWTLAVEEHFYLTLPFVLLALAYWGRLRWLVPLCLAYVPVAVLGLRCLSVWTNDAFASQMSATHLRLDALLFGVGIRAFAQQFPTRFAALRDWRRSLVCAGVLLWLPNVFIDPSTSLLRTVGLTTTLLGAAAFLVAAFHTHASDFRLSRRLALPAATLLGAIGVYSYAIYLWHVTAIGILDREVGQRVFAVTGTPSQWGWGASALAISAGTVMAGVIAGRAVEWPVLRLRDRFFPSRTGAVSPVTGQEAPGETTPIPHAPAVLSPDPARPAPGDA